MARPATNLSRHANPKSGHKFNSALATWKKLKSVKPDSINETRVSTEEASELETSPKFDPENYIIESGPLGELFIFYLNEKVLEIWDWIAPSLKTDRDTLYLQAHIKVRNSFNLQAFKVLSRQEEEYIAVAVVSENDTVNVDILSISSTSVDVAPRRIALPFASNSYSIKANDSFVCIGTDSGAIHVFRLDASKWVLSHANKESTLSNIKRNCCSIPKRDGINGFEDECVVLQSSCTDGMAIFDIIQGWLVYSPTKAEYTHMKNIKSDRGSWQTRDTLLKNETNGHQDPIVINFTSPFEKVEKRSLFTPVKLSRSTPMYNKLVSSLSKTTLDGIFKVSELSTATYKEYMESKLELNNIGKSIGKSLYTNIQKGSDFLKPNDNQILNVVDLSSDRLLATFKPLGGVSRVSFSKYDLQLATSNLRGDLLYIWDLYRLPIEVSLIGKFIRGSTSAIIKDIFWFNTEDDNRDTHAGFGCISKATGSIHWYNMNNISGENRTSINGGKLKRAKKTRGDLQKNDWTLSAFEGDRFLDVLDRQIGVLTKRGSLKMIDPTNGHNYYEYRIPLEPTAVFSNHDSFAAKESSRTPTRPKNPLAQAEIETCAPYLNLINCKEAEFATYLYESESFDDFGNDIALGGLGVQSISLEALNGHKMAIREVIPETDEFNKIYIDQEEDGDV